MADKEFIRLFIAKNSMYFPSVVPIVQKRKKIINRLQLLSRYCMIIVIT